MSPGYIFVSVKIGPEITQAFFLCKVVKDRPQNIELVEGSIEYTRKFGVIPICPHTLSEAINIIIDRLT